MNETSLNTTGQYRGYGVAQRGESDELLVRTSAASDCGEYLRRYWQPVALTREVTDVPKLIRVLGEELVLFRDKSGRHGLVHKQCPHRRASMEFGVCEQNGIRCCYHGWLFDIDGSIVEIPGQPENIQQLVKGKTSLGAYPVKEYRGLIFAYLGPIEQMPEFPVYDTLEIEGQILEPYRADYSCNWLQVLDAILDPIHTTFLPSTPETRGLFGRERLQSLKPGAGVINVGRVSTFDYDALAELLASGHLSGAVIDVFDEEPLPPDSPLWAAPNFVVTPQVSADDGDSYVPITLNP